MEREIFMLSFSIISKDTKSPLNLEAMMQAELKLPFRIAV